MSALSLPARAALPREALLRLVLKLDAAVTGANGLAYLAAAGPLEDLLGVEAAALRGIGTVLILFAAAVWFASTRAEPPRRLNGPGGRDPGRGVLSAGPRRGPSAGGQGAGAPRGDEPRPPVAPARPARRGSRSPGAGLRLVHRGLRHRRPQ